MSSVYACTLSFFLAVLNPVILALGAAGSSGEAGFSLPLVPHYRTAAGVLDELLLEGDAEGGMNITSIRPKMIPYSGAIYSVRVGIGSGETQHFYKLALDLVHPLTWMRCQPCIPEKKQDGSVFNTAVSPHYHFIASTDPRCTAPHKRAGQGQGRCTFEIKFQYERSRAHGLLSTDDFVFDGSGPGSPISGVGGLVFGCAHTTHNFINHDIWAGVMSLNRHPTSFIRQLSDRGLAASCFSYCLVGREHDNQRGFLRFGADIPDQSHTRSTKLLHGELAQGGGMYYVRLDGISLGGRRLTAITPAMFERNPHSLHGGCILDIGTADTLLTPDAYRVLVAEVVAHMHCRGVHRATVPGVQKLKLCFHGTWQSIRAHLPSMTLHFNPESAVLYIKPELLFVAVTHEHTKNTVSRKVSASRFTHLCESDFLISWMATCIILVDYRVESRGGRRPSMKIC
ncbi:protein ASPARTIC PROTEASE IN GUARD CELL 1-like [Aegilops tauschii subsp. strangulata]|uniref:Peptidase A1 domain-containing protein n=2 Tax=Aegilops tauschii TaxID=37682 RepID=A0A453APQ5_AEGTS|nr:protein ASPARTIC PROTEASE IN GUARD CELL 1-like [Aegilops tauschii subsp. strangulata]